MIVDMEAPYFPFYPGDWLSDGNVQAMTLEESGAYITLLAHMWKDGNDCSLPDDDRFLAKILHVTTNRWKKLREALIDGNGSVFYVREGRIRNPRMDKEFRAIIEKIEKSREAANTRWSRSKIDANAMQTQCERMPDASDPHMQNDAISDPDPESDPEKDQKTGSSPRVRDDSVSLTKTLAALFPHGMKHTTRHDIEEHMSKGMEPAMLQVAYQIASAENAKDKPSYISGVLRGWLNDGILTVAQHEQREAQRAVAVSARRVNNRGKPLAALGSGGAPPGQKDPRYEEFYKLFPDA